VHLVVLVEILQETLVDGVQVEDEKVVHGLIMPITTGREALQAHRLCSRAERPGPILINVHDPGRLARKHGPCCRGRNLHDPCCLAIGEQRPVPVTVYLRTGIDQQPRRVGLVPVRQCRSRAAMAAPRLHLISGACAGRRRCTRRIGRARVRDSCSVSSRARVDTEDVVDLTAAPF